MQYTQSPTYLKLLDWQEDVYGEHIHPKLPANWPKIRERILKRDGFECARCGDTVKRARLTVHHIIPREQGGGYQDENLITLCEHCHDLVEDVGLRTRGAIINWIGGDERPVKDDREIGQAWQSWVYGGYRRPG